MTDSQNRGARRFHVSWAWAPVILLGCMFAGLGTLATLAIDDEGFALEPNYYEKAMNWDRARAQKAENERLGFQLQLTQELLTRATGEAVLQVELVDANGAPLSSAVVRVEAFPNAHATHIRKLALSERSPGVYEARLPLAELGLWELRFTVSHDGRVFTSVLRRDVSRGDRA